MKNFASALLAVLLLNFGALSAQSDLNIKAKVDEVAAIINEHKAPLEEVKEALEGHQTHLEERIIVLKYHAGNKEVQDASRLVVTRVEEYYKAVESKIASYESVWFEQTRNMIAIYTHYGHLREATGGGATDLSDFVTLHDRYLELIASIKSDMSMVYTNLQTIKNAI
jgi:hypothetical protein